MNPRLGWSLALVAMVAGWLVGRWQGVALVFSALVFGLMMQFSRSVRVMRAAAEAPVGRVPSVVMLQASLRPGLPMLDIVRRCGSLGRRLSEVPDLWAWADAGGNELRVEFDAGRCTRWELVRPADAGA